jgi:Helicase associated domain
MTTFPTTNIRWDDNENDGMDNNSTHVETTTATLPSSEVSTIAPTVTVVSDIEINHPLLQTDTDGETTSRIQQHGTTTCSTGDDGTSSTKVPIRILETISTATTAPPATTTTTEQPKTSAGTVATNSSSSKNDSVDCSAKRKAVEMEDVDHSSTVPVDDAATTTTATAAAGLDSTATTTKRLRREVPARISWDDRIQSLMEFQAEHGHLNIPIRYKKNPSLGKFVHNTREQYKLYHHKCKPGYQKRCSLSAGRIAELDALGFLWTTDRMQRQNNDWAARLEQLKEYKIKHGVRICILCHNVCVCVLACTGKLAKLYNFISISWNN